MPALGSYSDEHGVTRLQSDGLEIKEQRLTMFTNPHCMPVGQQRQAIGDTGFLRQAGPMLQQAQMQEQKIMGLFEEERSPKIGGVRRRPHP